MVPRAGLEPARPFGLGILSPLCLPFHHRGNYVFAGFLKVTPDFSGCGYTFGYTCNVVKSTETKRSDEREYTTVMDGRNQPIRRLYKRDGAFYTRFTTIDQAGRKRKVWRSLSTASTVPAAKAAMLKLISEAAQVTIPVQGRCPTFLAYSERFLEEASKVSMLTSCRFIWVTLSGRSPCVGNEVINPSSRARFSTQRSVMTYRLQVRGLSPFFLRSAMALLMWVR
jgi:hypothetical protein